MIFKIELRKGIRRVSETWYVESESEERIRALLPHDDNSVDSFEVSPLPLLSLAGFRMLEHSWGDRGWFHRCDRCGLSKPRVPDGDWGPCRHTP